MRAPAPCQDDVPNFARVTSRQPIPSYSRARGTAEHQRLECTAPPAPSWHRAFWPRLSPVPFATCRSFPWKSLNLDSRKRRFRRPCPCVTASKGCPARSIVDLDEQTPPARCPPSTSPRRSARAPPLGPAPRLEAAEPALAAPLPPVEVAVPAQKNARRRLAAPPGEQNRHSDTSKRAPPRPDRLRPVSPSLAPRPRAPPAAPAASPPPQAPPEPPPSSPAPAPDPG